MDRCGRETHITLHPSPVHPPPPYLPSFLKRVTLFWGSKPQMTVWYRVGEDWGFCLKKEKIKSRELLQLGQMERTTEAVMPIHTYIHA